jgi:hypothetical protein
MTPDEFEFWTGKPLTSFAHRCHEASLALVKAMGTGRVARGSCSGVGGQHSWVVLGHDVYDPEAEILDPTLWSYIDRDPFIWRGTLRAEMHRPHGSGSIWEYGMPTSAGGPEIPAPAGLDPSAQMFLDMILPLDLTGWAQLANAPVGGGWPAKQIIEAMYGDPVLRPLIPIDIVGMATDLNPEGLYLP